MKASSQTFSPHVYLLKPCYSNLLWSFCHFDKESKSLFKGLQMCLHSSWIWALTAEQSAKSDWLISLSEAKKPPVFDVPLKPATVDVGEKLILRCHVCGSSPLKIQWMKDRKELTPSSSTRISFSDGTACLEISTVSKLNAGDYLCKATNEAGSEFCKAKVTVKGKKKEEKVKSNITWALYSKILFICSCFYFSKVEKFRFLLLLRIFHL